MRCLVRNFGESVIADNFLSRGADHRGVPSAPKAIAPVKRTAFPADSLTVPAKGILIRVPIEASQFDACDIKPKHMPQPDLEVSVAVTDAESAYLKARLNGQTFRRVIRRLRDDQEAGNPIGRLFLVGRIVTPGVVTDPGIQYEYA